MFRLGCIRLSVELYIGLDGMESDGIDLGGRAIGVKISWAGNYNYSSSFTPRVWSFCDKLDSLTKQKRDIYSEYVVYHGIPHSEQQTINSSLYCYSNATTTKNPYAKLTLQSLVILAFGSLTTAVLALPPLPSV